jgi:hypothetical protein
MLPDYALKQVNMREGWQILSDIGHIHGVTWEEQNKLYSASHALTRLLCSSPERFYSFILHYEACLSEHYKRFGEHSPLAFRYFAHFTPEIQQSLVDRLPADEHESTRRYLLEYKADKLKEAEKARLMEVTEL